MGDFEIVISHKSTIEIPFEPISTAYSAASQNCNPKKTHCADISANRCTLRYVQKKISSEQEAQVYVNVWRKQKIK